ncbi:uncharacterized protein LOC132589726 [Heteronotia binoei]|uniref:uncharacterized protein LOC132589726 n=1 Tax=Heteronotia binoei TaxID=13085 RepID=UPI00293090CB|nr:uncharacterized protein LOC132589726 [Heteronotia binoei]
MTAFINGKKITTKRHLENESKYLEVEEDGKTVSIHVNGIPVYDRNNNGAKGNEWNYKLDKRHQCPQKNRIWTCEKRRWANEWRRWAEKWRNWAEECRNWAEESYHQEDKSCSTSAARNCQKDTRYPKVNEEHSNSDKGCPRPGRRHPPFSKPGEGKPDLNQRQCKTNKGQPWPEEKLTSPEKGYFVFPKPGENNSGMDETHVRKNKKQHRPETKHPVSDKDDPGFSKPGEGHADQDVRTNKGQPKPDEGCSQEDKEHHGFQRPDQETCAHKKSSPVHTETKDETKDGHMSMSMKQKMVTGCSSQAGNKKAPVGIHDQQSEESKQRSMRSEGPLGKNEQKNAKLEQQCENGESTLKSGQEKRTELHDVTKKASACAKQASKPQLTTCGAKGPPLKKKESPVRMRKPCAKWTRSQTGRRKLYTRRNISQAGQNRMPDEHSKAGVEWNGPCTKSKEVASERKKIPVGCKQGPPNRKKCHLPPLQELSLLAKKKLLRRRVYHLPPETKDEKHPLITETNLFLNTNSQQRGRLIKLPRNISHLPSIQGQKFQTNQSPNLIH